MTLVVLQAIRLYIKYVQYFIDKNLKPKIIVLFSDIHISDGYLK